MLKWLIRRQLAKFERDFGYDTSYMRDVLDADVRALLLFAKVSKLAAYRKDVPPDAWFAAKITGAMAEDCGPCTQLVVTMAERAGVTPAVLAAVVRGDDAALPADARLGRAFAQATLARAPEADALREEARRRWGPRGLVSLGFAVTAARLFPTLKYALGHGRACTRVTVGGAVVPAARPGIGGVAAA